MRQKVLIWLASTAITLSMFCIGATAQDPIPLPELDSKRLLNGLQITVASSTNFADEMAIGLGLRYGAAFDSEDKGGGANLLSRLFMTATIDRTLEGIQAELSYLNATLEVSCDWDGFRFLMRGKNSTWERALLLLYQVVAEAQFREEAFAAEKQAVIEDLSRPADPRRKIHTQFESVLFSGTTYGRPLEGTAASVSTLRLGDLRLFYRKYFTPSQASLHIVGNVPPLEVLSKASRIWGIWVSQDDIPFTFLPPRQPAGRKIFLEDDPDSPAAQFITGSLFPRRQDTVFENASLAVNILQERLTELLPTSLVTANHEGRRLAGPFYIQGQAAAEQAVDEIRKIQNAVEQMKTTLVSDEELESAKTARIEAFNRQMMSVDGICNIMMDSEIYRLGSIYTVAFPDRIRRCSPESIRKAAVDWIMPSGEILLIRGAAAALKQDLSSLGTVQDLLP